MKTTKQYKSFKQTKAKWGKDLDFKKVYDGLSIEFSLINAMIKYRIKNGISQSQLAEKIGTKQSSIARFESGSYNPSLAFVKKIAGALGARIHVETK